MKEELAYKPFWVEVAGTLRSTLNSAKYYTNILQGVHVQLMNIQPQQPPSPTTMLPRSYIMD